MSFINQPLIDNQNKTIYKLWLINFDLDIDCIDIIKYLTYRLCMKRVLNIPTPKEINNGFYLSPNKKCYYINDQGLVFKFRGNKPPPIFHTQCGIELYTYEKCHKTNILINNIYSFLLSYYPHEIVELEFKLSGITDIIIEWDKHNDIADDKWHYSLFNSQITFY